MVDRDDWKDLVSGRSNPSDCLVITVPLKKNTGRGGSGAFLGRGSDGRRWWVKPPNHRQDGQVLATEYIVGSVGALIEAPVCEVAIARIPPDLVGWEFVDAIGLQEGLCHASLAIEPAAEVNDLTARERDDNQIRYAGVEALYDWCWGGDDQWLVCDAEDKKVYSHDHGWYLPETGANFDESSLVARVDEPHPCPKTPVDLAAEHREFFAQKLEAVTRESLVNVLKKIPLDYPVSDADIEAAGFFLERRSDQVASRLRAIGGGGP